MTPRLMTQAAEPAAKLRRTEAQIVELRKDLEHDAAIGDDHAAEATKQLLVVYTREAETLTAELAEPIGMGVTWVPVEGV
jgi:hypothetical protein